MTPARRWRKSSYSEATGNSDCIELGWRKSTFSQASGNSNCLEVAPTLDAIRDSKNPTGPILTIPTLPTLLTHLKTAHFPQ